MVVADIFREKPEKYGCRGDEFFWEYLEKRTEGIPFPFEYEKLECLIKLEYLLASGEEMTEKSLGFSRELSNGGMSSGIISGEYWLNQALPLLKTRIDKANIEAQKQENSKKKSIFNLFKKKKTINYDVNKKEEIDKEVNFSNLYLVEFPFKGIRELELDEEPKEDEFMAGELLIKAADKEFIEYVKWNWYASTLTDFMDQPLKEKVNNFYLTLNANGKCIAVIPTYSELTEEDKKYLLDFIKGQASDGIGEEDYVYEYEGKKYSLLFWWKQDDWYIKFIK